MRKTLYLFVVLLLARAPSHAQVDIFDNIDLGPASGNLQLISTPGAWGVTHGTPSYDGTAQTLWTWSAYQVYQNQSGNMGEGVYRRVDFTPGSNYKVEIGIPYFNAAVFTNAKFNVYLCNDPIPPNCNTSGCLIPTLASSRLLYTYEGGSFTDQTLHLTFSTAPNESYQYIVIYPGPNSSATKIELTISCLGIRSCASADLSYCNIIPGGNLYWNNVYIGSSFCFSSGEATPTLNTMTNVTGIRSIVVGPKTTLSASSGSPFIMKISPCTTTMQPVQTGQVIANFSPFACAIGRPEGDPKNTGAGSTLASFANPDQPDLSKMLSVYPNPTKDGMVTLSYGNYSFDGDVYVQNVAGQTLKIITVSGIHPKLNLSGLPHGIYFIKAVNSNKVYTGRLIKQ